MSFRSYQNTRSSPTTEIARVGGRSPFKVIRVTDDCTSRKPVCDFLLVNNSNLHPISRRSPVIPQYWSDGRRLWQGDASR